MSLINNTAMKITVKDPLTKSILVLEAKPEQLHHEFGYRIIYPSGSNFFISNRLGVWRPADDHPIDTELLVEISLALEGLKDEAFS